MKVKHIIGVVIIAILFTFFIVADCILLEPTMRTTVSGLLCSPEPLPTLDDDDDEDGEDGAQAVSRRVVEEGSVLVRNENGVLPLAADNKKINVFGRASTDWLFGGSGSGRVVNENDGGENIGLLEALKQYNVSYNTELSEKYLSWLAPQGVGGSIGGNVKGYYRIADPHINDKSVYSDEVLSNAKAFSDTAIVVIARRAGETVDCPKVQYKHKTSPGIADTDESRHYLEISEEEESLLKYVGANYENVIVLINSTNVMELGFLETIPGIDSCLVTGVTGTRGAMGIPPLLYGTVSPSGRLADTYVYEMEDHLNYNHTGYDGVTFYNDGSGLYPDGVNLNSWDKRPTGPYYIDYVEGIYVGYRWFETADAEGIWNDRTRDVLDGAGNTVTETGYNAVVQYPFGYGLSYANCDWELREVSPAAGSDITLDTEISLTVRVSNGSENKPARDVVQLYGTPQYYDGEIEKSAVNLIDYEKTDDIEVGQYVDVTFKLKGSDLVSYDCYDKNGNGNKGYELDRGAYTFSLRSDSHTVKCDTVTYNIVETQNMLNDPNTGNRVQNRFTADDALDGISVDGMGETGGNQTIAYISRSNFPSRAAERAAARTMPQNLKDTVLYTSAMEKAWNDAEKDVYGEDIDKTAVTFGSGGGLKVFENGSITELGKKLGMPENWDSEDWDRLLDQLDRNEAFRMIGIGAAGTPAAESVGKPQLIDYDGPAQAGGFNSAVKVKGAGYPAAFVLAQTWNKRLAYEYGSSFGEQMKDVAGMNGVFGPGCNIHRSPFGGRNFEYYSEDSLLSGKTVANVVAGLKSQGRYAFVKHFAVAETETGRDSYYSWVSEQALREIYLTPFRYAVEEGGTVGIMTSYNRVGGIWAGGSVALQDAVLRKEWGFKGAIITDFSDHNEYMNMNQSIRMGGDMGMSVGLTGSNTSGARFDGEVRAAVKNILYMWLNAEYTATIANNSYVSTSGLSAPWEWWVPTLVDIQILVYASCAVWLYFIIAGTVKYRKEKKRAVASLSVGTSETVTIAEADVTEAEKADKAENSEAAEAPESEKTETVISDVESEKQAKEAKPKLTPEERAEKYAARAEAMEQRAERAEQTAEKAELKAKNAGQIAEKARLKAADYKSKAEKIKNDGNKGADHE